MPTTPKEKPRPGRGRSGLLRDGRDGAPGDFRPRSIQYISRGGDVTRITSFRFPLTVSKRGNSSKADAHDATLIDGVALASPRFLPDQGRTACAAARIRR